MGHLRAPERRERHDFDTPVLCRQDGSSFVEERVTGLGKRVGRAEGSLAREARWKFPPLWRAPLVLGAVKVESVPLKKTGAERAEVYLLFDWAAIRQRL